MSDSQKFQVNLRGVIELLSDHLYTSPQIYLRELLQNAVDAIVARQHQEPEHAGDIRLEVIEATAKRPAVLTVTDDGIGLTEDEIHQFLATIGESSKRGAAKRDDFIGQFGIGLLSAFVVSDEIVIVTKSLRPGSPTLEWRGRPDGTYSLRTLQADVEPGTQVHLRAKEGQEEHFQLDKVRDTATHFGCFLPIRVEVSARKQRTIINAEPPWMLAKQDTAENRDELLAYGKQVFDQDFFDVIPLRSVAGGVEGVAFVLSEAAPISAKRTHRVYLKNMLLSESAENLLPDWAFFVKCVVNATKLRPTASRESFYDDAKLVRTREELGQCLKKYLMRLAKQDHQRLDTLIARHYLAIKSLAIDDDEFFRLFIDWLPFESTLGTMTLGEHFAKQTQLRYVPSVDQFRQIAGVAAAQGLTVFNTGYTYDTDLFEKLVETFPDREVTLVDVNDLTQAFEELTLDERDEVFDLIELADRVLQPLKCSVEIRKFAPATLPTLYTLNDAATFLRSIEQTQEETDDLWTDVLDNLATTPATDACSQLCLNYNNPLVRKLAGVRHRELVRRAIEMLYVQSLLLGHYPLNPKETLLLSEGLLGLIELGIAAQSKTTTRDSGQSGAE
ncbi:MAG: HSP90 family protein [Planctomycetaceae bacterium]